MRTPEEEKTIAAYDAIAEEWVRTHDTPDYWAAELDHFQELLPHGRVLEIGVGGGRDALQLLARGYQYVGIEPSERLLVIARERLPTASLLKQDVYTLSFPEGTLFDGFWASAVLLHIPRERIAEALKSIREWVRPGGVGFISLKKGGGEYVGDRSESLADDKRLLVLYTLDEFRQVLVENGFGILLAYEKKVSERTTWLVFFVRNDVA